MIADSTIQELHLNANPAANTGSSTGWTVIELNKMESIKEGTL